jgi:hypothetical protein
VRTSSSLKGLIMAVINFMQVPLPHARRAGSELSFWPKHRVAVRWPFKRSQDPCQSGGAYATDWIHVKKSAVFSGDPYFCDREVPID